MKVFITGASGFIGKQLLKHIESDSRFEEVFCLCRKDIIDLPSRFTIINGSLEDLSRTPGFNADVCIHLAAVTNSVSVDDSDIFRINSDGTAEIIAFCKKNNIPRIVFLSSINVYLEKKYAYALSKISAEEHIKNSGLEYSILRCSLVYGEGCQSFDKIICFIKQFHIVPVFGNGKAYEQPIYIDEVCNEIIRHVFLIKESKILDLYGKTKMTYNEMVRQLAEKVNSRIFFILHLPKTPFVALSEFCCRHKICFPIQPEQISHMCEDLHCKSNENNLTENYQLDEFSVNLNKYIQ